MKRSVSVIGGAHTGDKALLAGRNLYALDNRSIKGIKNGGTNYENEGVRGLYKAKAFALAVGIAHLLGQGKNALHRVRVEAVDAAVVQNHGDAGGGETGRSGNVLEGDFFCHAVYPFTNGCLLVAGWYWSALGARQPLSAS